MVGEVLKWRRSCPLFTLKQHGNERAHQYDCRCDLCAIEAGNLRQAVAPGAIANLVVILDIAEKPALRYLPSWSAVDTVAII